MTMRKAKNLSMAINEQNTLYVTVQDARATLLSTGQVGLVLQTDGAEPIVFELTPALAKRIRRALDEVEAASAAVVGQ